jgi:hypothetical protein
MESVMLAPNYLDAKSLGLSEDRRTALIKTLKDFEQGRVEEFNMGSWASCMAGYCDKTYGTAFRLRGQYASFYASSDALDLLFGSQMMQDRMEKITIDEAARALRNYLTTGSPQW